MKFFNSFKKWKQAVYSAQKDSGPAPMSSGSPIAGYVDDVSSDCISGWCVPLSNPKELPKLDLIVADEVLASTPTHILREDIPAKFGRKARVGFKLHIGKALASGILEMQSKESGSGGMAPFIPFQIRVSGHDVFLPAAPGVELRLARQDIDCLARGEYFNVKDPFRVRFERLREAAESAPVEGESQPVRLIAFYLPQFHPFPENSEWWGEGFTDWTNVVNAKPQFPEHYQPHLPADLGFYDLRLPEVRERQAQLAREYGIHGFCYHYYWFAGRTLMDTPIRGMLESGKPELPFCICWANEPWSRRWDGSEHEVLLGQPHEINTDERFVLDIMPYLKDERYIRVNGAPLIIIYRVSLLPDAPELIRRWRVIAAGQGISDLHIVMAETFGLEDPHRFGCDAAVEFPPHRLAVPEISDKIFAAEQRDGFKGAVFDYNDVAKKEMLKPGPGYALYRGIIPCWDNTARRGAAGHIFHNASPESYEIWLRRLIDYTEDNLPSGQRFVFINAWNEWAEGAHLEPDREYGRRYLEATRRSISGRTSADSVLLELEMAHSGNKAMERVLSTLRNELERLKQANQYMAEHCVSAYHLYNQKNSHWLRELDFDARKIEWDAEEVRFYVDRINQYASSEIQSELVLDRHEFLELVGWLFVKGFKGLGIHSYLVVRHEDGEHWIAFLRHRFDRPDVNGTFHGQVQMRAGFEVMVSCKDLLPGRYELSFIVTDGSRWKGKQCPFSMRVI